MTQNDLFAKSAVASWKLHLGRADQTFAGFTDAELQQEIAPGKNRIFYLLGHLTAVHDRMLPLLGFGTRLHPELDEAFITNADRAAPDRVSAGELRQAWSTVNAALTSAIEALPSEDWLTKHDAVSTDDFAKEPLRNRLSVLLSRTAHVHYHLGQVRLAVKKDS